MIDVDEARRAVLDCTAPLTYESERLADALGRVLAEDLGIFGESLDVAGRRQLDRIWHNGLPVTTPSQTIIDFAATGSTDLLRFMLANADHDDILDVARGRARAQEAVS